MGDDVKNKLCELIRAQGKQILYDQSKFTSLMLDLCLGANRREINILATALAEKVPQNLLNSSNTSLTRELKANLTSRLENETGLNADAADWAVTAWAEALGMSTWENTKVRNAETQEAPAELKNNIQTQPKANPVIGLDHTILDFGKVASGGKLSRAIQVRNLGTGMLMGKVTTAESWIEVSPQILDVSGLGQVITVTVDNSSPLLKTHEPGHINIESNGGSAKIEVNVIVSDKPKRRFKTWMIASGMVAMIAIVGIASSLVYQSIVRGNPAQEHLIAGQNYTDQKQWDRAIDEFNKAIEIDPNLAGAYSGRGDAFSYRREYYRALADYTMVIQLEPNNAAAYYSRGNAYDEKDEYNKAIADYTRAIELAPNLAEAYNNRGYVYVEKGEYDKAIADYTMATQLNPNYAAAYYNRGYVHDEKGEYDEAIADYTLAIEKNPRDPESYNTRGHVYIEKGMYDNAVDDCTRAIELNPWNDRYYYNRGLAYQNSGQIDKAEADFNKAKELRNPTWPNMTGQ